MVPDPPGEPPSAGVPQSSSGQSTGPVSVPVTGRARSSTWFGQDSPSRRFLSRWGFPLFVLMIVILGRGVLLPFVFASLIAYILAPVIDWMSERPDGTKRMPRGLAIIMCYIVFLASIAGFLLLLVPRLSSDIARLGKETPAMLTKINEEYTPQVARWIEHKFPSLAQPKAVEDHEIVPDMPIPPGTGLTFTPLPDGRYAVQVTPSGLDIKPTPDGGFHIQPVETRADSQNTEDKLRRYVSNSLEGLRSQVNELLRLGQELVAGLIRGIFMFFFTLMIAAFMLIDLDKVHGFLRSLVPQNVRDDYDVIKAGIDRGLSGVIRGQLVICLINSILTYIGLLVFGVNYSLILALVAGMMSLIPIFGSILSSVPIVMVALVSGESGLDVFRGVAMTLWIIGIHFIEANLLNPKIIGTAAKIHPVLVIFALFFGEANYGLVGALLAVPVLSAIQVIFMFFYKKAWKGVAPRPGSGPVKYETGPLPPTKS